MGAYLSQPITEKEIEKGENAALAYAVAAMQGWRTEMEDAHVCSLDIANETSIFGVFDGHGGKEVAKFVALHIVEELLSTPGFGAANLMAGLKETYLSLDARIRSEKSRSELLQLSAAGKKSAEEESLERVVHMENLPKLLREAIDASRSDRITGSRSPDDSVSDFSDSDFECETRDGEEGSRGGNVGCFPIVLSDTSSGSDSEVETPRERASPKVDLGGAEPPAPRERSIVAEAKPSQNPGVVNAPTALLSASDSTDSAVCRSSVDNGGNAAERTTPASTPNAKHPLPSIHAPPSHKPPARQTTGWLLFLMCPFACLRDVEAPSPDEVQLLSPCCSSPHSTASAMPTPSAVKAEQVPSVLEDAFVTAASPSLEREDRGVGPSEATETLLASSEETNGRDVTVAGCTAVVAVIQRNVLFVANAGDSRCVLCHDGIALPMSRDHKPTDPEEYVRIKNAGGFVSDGRVNGCLNLSRALGDMEYKRTADLAPEAYMITANPDVKTMELQSGDQFLILACDGIWDVLSDQEACDFVLSRLRRKHSLDSISAELCDFCLAEDADGSGEGCDNMTAMIVLLKDHTTEQCSR